MSANSNKALGHAHKSLWSLVVWPNMQSNNLTNLISHKYIRSIKIMIWHMRNMRNIRIRIRDIVSGLHTLLLFLLDISLGELDEFLTFSVHPRVVLVTIFVANPTLDVWPFCIQEDTPYIFYLFILLILNFLLWRLRSNLWYVFPFSSFFTTLLRLSWGGCTLAYFFNLFTSSSSFFTSLFKWSFSWAICSSQVFTLTWLVEASLLVEVLEVLD
jgi:hypothetical protein